MRLWTAIFLAVCFGIPLEAADTAADAQPLPGPEFMELLAKRQIELSPAQSGNAQAVSVGYEEGG